MPDRNGQPQPGEEVLFADGTTATIKRYMRSRVIGYRDSTEPLPYSDEAASEPVVGHVVEMAKPCKTEFVTVITFLPSGFWQPVNIAAELAPDQRYEERFEQVDAATKDRLVRGSWDLTFVERHPTLAKYAIATALYLVGLLSGIVIGKLGCG